MGAPLRAGPAGGRAAACRRHLSGGGHRRDAGFPYLSGLDPALAIARRSTPRLAVPVGSVIVGGAQAAVMPQTSPSGWHIVGRTNIALFDPHRDEPSTLAPGDIVRFTIEDVWL